MEHHHQLAKSARQPSRSAPSQRMGGAPRAHSWLTRTLFAPQARVFAGVRDSVGHSFEDLFDLFREMLSPGCGIPQQAKWVQKARLWRFVLLASPEDGHFELGQGLSTALMAQARGLPAQAKSAAAQTVRCGAAPVGSLRSQAPREPPVVCVGAAD